MGVEGVCRHALLVKIVKAVSELPVGDGLHLDRRALLKHLQVEVREGASEMVKEMG